MIKKTILNAADITGLINAMKRIFPTREDVEKIVEDSLNAKMKFFPTRDEFFTRMDELYGEIQKMREEQTLHAGQHQQINDRLDTLETKTGVATSL